MSFDRATRNLLANAVGKIRERLKTDVMDELRRLGFQDDGAVLDLASIGGLTEGERTAAEELRALLQHLIAAEQGADGAGARGRSAREIAQAAYDRMAREIGFTTLNRLVALRMAEERGLIVQSVGAGMGSNGFLLYERLVGSALGSRHQTYRAYLECLYDEIGRDLPALFDRSDPHARIFPGERCLEEVLALLNAGELAHLWAEDETIGWVYQYYNDPDERKKMRESQAPRTSRELAVRNQFFTPRYVVEFLTDNTLGRTWYEMRQGNTRLTDQCRYLVRRSDEVFFSALTSTAREYVDEDTVAAATLLLEGTEETFPPYSTDDIHRAVVLAHVVNGYLRHPRDMRDELDGVSWPVAMKTRMQAAASLNEFTTQDILDTMFRRRMGGWDSQDDPFFCRLANEVRRRALEWRRADLSQQELLRQPVFVPYRAPKDPRDLKILDPACGSGHFLLYAFDLLTTIYEEAWAWEVSPPSEVTGNTLQVDYPDMEALRRAVPGLILAHNLHGTDIDPRACQIAALALWLRAQRAYRSFGLKAEERPPISHGNIVCAAPMPGERDHFTRFLADLNSPTLARLAEAMWDELALASVAGSLLKPEERLRKIVAEEHARHSAQSRGVQQAMFAELLPLAQQMLDFSDVTDDRFWDDAEKRILAVLREYGEAFEAAGATTRRLFAADGAQGFRFVDLLRQKYDLALMNPPFGSGASEAKRYIDSNYQGWRYDLYPCFISRTVEMLNMTGCLGYLAPRTGYFSHRMALWRRTVLLGKSRLLLLADLGHGVLDGALVEVASGVITADNSAESLISVNCLAASAAEKGTALGDAVGPYRTIRQQLITLNQHREFLSLPGAKLLLGAPRALIKRFSLDQPLDPWKAVVREGPHTADNDRFVRLWWEVPAHMETRHSWPFYAKGGDYAPYMANPHLVLDWRHCGNDIALGEHSVLPSKGIYFQAGLTYTERTASVFNIRVLPEGCIFSQAGPIVCSRHASDTLPLLGYLMSLPARSILELLVGSGDGAASGSAARHFLAGVIGSTPIPDFSSAAWMRLGELALSCVRNSRFLHGQTEDDIHFIVTPCLWTSIFMHVRATQKMRLQEVRNVLMASWEIERLVCDHLGLDIEDLQRCYTLVSAHAFSFPIKDVEPAKLEDFESLSEDEIVDAVASLVEGRAATKQAFQANRSFELACLMLKAHPDSLIPSWPEPGRSYHLQAAASLISLAIGCVLGRWDICYAMGEKHVSELPDPFAPLPVCPPGMLQNALGLPSTADDVPADYPLRISWLGILVEDNSHSEDIERRVQEAFQVIWRDRAEAIEHEVNQTLGTRNLLAYFHEPTGFFADHLSRYSKSRRQAPIYWPLSTTSGSYTIWLYYHRLTSDTLFTAVNRYVLPKLADVERDLADLSARLDGASGREASRLREEVETVGAFRAELIAFRDELLRVAALPYRPNLNDGVIINAAPLHKLFRLPKWAKDTRECWTKLERGDYDWAHLAYTIWPDRVREKCRTDKSLAIAHGLEELYIEPPATTKKRRAKAAAVQQPSLDGEEDDDA